MPEEVRCTKCNKLLYKTCEVSNDELVEIDIEHGIQIYRHTSGLKVIDVTIKCPRCGEMNTNTVK